jgi:hypothetical protein
MFASHDDKRLGYSHHASGDYVVEEIVRQLANQSNRQNKEQIETGADWTLNRCCDTFDILFIVLYVVYHIIIHLLWWRKYPGSNSYILSPLKILAVFLHEFGHGSAAVLTCGKFVSITVNADETGLAVFSPGYMPLCLFGGYVGGAFWGCAFVALSGNRIGSTVAAGLLVFALLMSLSTKPNKVVVYTVITFTIVTVGAVAIDWFLFDPFLQYFTLFYGVFFGYYAIRDIWDDTVAENKEGSDSVRCFSMYKCFGSPRNIGIIYLLLALILHVIGIYLGLVWMSSTTYPTS